MLYLCTVPVHRLSRKLERPFKLRKPFKKECVLCGAWLSCSVTRDTAVSSSLGSLHQGRSRKKPVHRPSVYNPAVLAWKLWMAKRPVFSKHACGVPSVFHSAPPEASLRIVLQELTDVYKAVDAYRLVVDLSENNFTTEYIKYSHNGFQTTTCNCTLWICH